MPYNSEPEYTEQKLRRASESESELDPESETGRCEVAEQGV